MKKTTLEERFAEECRQIASHRQMLVNAALAEERKNFAKLVCEKGKDCVFFVDTWRGRERPCVVDGIDERDGDTTVRFVDLETGWTYRIDAEFAILLDFVPKKRLSRFYRNGGEKPLPSGMGI